MRLSWFGIVTVIMVGLACGGTSNRSDASGIGGSGAGGSGTTSVFSRTFGASINRNVDILFLVDDSSSMKLAQDKLRANFFAFTDALRNLPGGLPNLHLAVVSSDMGASDSIQQCNSLGGKSGVFQSVQRDATACAMGSLNAGARFISDVAGVRNYTGTLEGAFSCVAALGDTGCGFEQQFAALTRALGVDGQGAPPAENAGFLRPDAYLAIIMLTNEDDCSTAVGPNFYDSSANVNLLSQLGPVLSYRCNEFGHLCNGAPPPRLAPGGQVTATVDLMNCVSAEGSGYLKTVAETIAQVKSAKADPSQIIVASIQGAPTPYRVHWTNALTTDTGPWPEITHSCTASDGSFGDPGVRTQQFVDAFGTNGLAMSICDGSFSPGLQRIAMLMGQWLSPPCISGSVKYAANKPGQPDCTVVAHVLESGTLRDKVVPWCEGNGNVPPCWNLSKSASVCNGNPALEVSPDPSVPAGAVSSVTVMCALCVAGVTDPLECF